MGNMSMIELALKVAWRFVGKPYKWGGDDPMAGFDCSGLCVEILKSTGTLSRSGDWTAESLYRYFKGNTKEFASAGCLVFWGNGGKMTHVEFCIDNVHTIGASGGGSKTITVQDAINQNAYIKVRPIRNGHAAIVYPF